MERDKSLHVHNGTHEYLQFQDNSEIKNNNEDTCNFICLWVHNDPQLGRLIRLVGKMSEITVQHLHKILAVHKLVSVVSAQHTRSPRPRGTPSRSMTSFTASSTLLMWKKHTIQTWFAHQQPQTKKKKLSSTSQQQQKCPYQKIQVL